jgi:drug/metabolite transporter (DMT)-like permease
MLVCLRSLIGFLALLGLMTLIQRGPGRRMLLADWGDTAWVALLGGLLAMHWCCYFWSVKLATVAVGMLCTFTFPAMTALAEPLLFGERIRRSTLINALVTLLGVGLVAFGQQPSDPASQPLLGALCGLGAAALFAARNLLSRRLLQRYETLPLMTWQLLAAGLVMAAIWPLYGLPAQPITARDLALLLLLGVGISAIGHSLFVYSFEGLKVSTASVINCMQPLYGTLLAIPLMNEWPGPWTWVGGAVILAAVVRESRAKGRNPPGPEEGPALTMSDPTLRAASSDAAERP